MITFNELTLLIMSVKLFFGIIGGILVGDYLLQPETMAIRKGANTLDGWWMCYVHAIIYTISTVAIIQHSWFSLLFIAITVVSASKLSLGNKAWEAHIYNAGILASALLLPWDYTTNWLFPAVFLTHFPIDKFSMGSWWLWLINGRDFRKEYAALQEERKKAITEQKELFSEISIPFACCVYIIVDNTIHFVLLWCVMQWIIHHFYLGI